MLQMQRRSDGTVEYTLIPKGATVQVRDPPVLLPRVAPSGRRPKSAWIARNDVAILSMLDAVAEVMSDTVGNDDDLGWNPKVLQSEFVKHVYKHSTSAQKNQSLD
jgi:hypothetical protein